MHLRFRKWDIAVVFSVVLLAVIIFFAYLSRDKAAGAVAEIYQDGARIKTVSLAENQEFTVEGKYSNTITVRDGKIGITSSNCPGEDCVHSGWISTAGRSIICLPNGLEIRITSGNSDVDFVVG